MKRVSVYKRTPRRIKMPYRQEGLQEYGGGYAYTRGDRDLIVIPIQLEPDNNSSVAHPLRKVFPMNVNPSPKPLRQYDHV
jgi:hypothetical protein